MSKLILKDGTELNIEALSTDNDFMSITMNGTFSDVSNLSTRLSDSNLSEFSYEGTEYRKYHLDTVNAHDGKLWFMLMSLGSSVAKQLSDLQEAVAELYEMQLGDVE